MKPGVKAILFDFFGVISDSDYWNDVMRLELAAGHGERFETLAESMNSGRIAWRQFCAEMAQDLGIAESIVQERYEKLHLNPEVINVARGLRGSYAVCLATNAHHHFMEPALEQTGLNKVFEHIFISSRLGATKPNRTFFESILSELQVNPEECVLIDDAGLNVEGAEEAGLRGIVFTDAAQLTAELARLL